MRIIYNKKCPECQSHDIRYDESKGEIFCWNCGLILENRFELISIPDIIDYMKLIEHDERERMMRDLE